MKPTEEETKRYYQSFIAWLTAFHPLEAMQAKFNGVDRESFNHLIRDWAQTITNKGN
jgi:hypothetical protein